MQIKFETLFKLDCPETFTNINEFEKQLFYFLDSGELSEDSPPKVLLSLRRHLVDCLENKLKIEIFSNEHSPPHFHVKGGKIDASFTIQNCELLNGKVNAHDFKLIRFWYDKMGERLVEI